MSSLPVLAFLLLLAHCTSPAQGQPLPIDFQTLLKEIKDLLNQPAVLPEGDLDFDDKFILLNKTFLKANLEEFLNAAKNFKDRAEKIKKILVAFRPVMPTSTSTEDPISINTNDWDDFRRKLKKFVDSLEKFINAKNVSSTPSPISVPF
ncbi:interleukin-3-like [Pteronotus mesoamericanus]|uniref:interleukin-3-like n=1 Tax=Pteronotus mesoamericanus TaxID=1884717 RepID=UPI0023ED3BD8|nr:interleukin-3-like [Pteronotus parnellii mesoamericanus]